MTHDGRHRASRVVPRTLAAFGVCLAGVVLAGTALAAVSASNGSTAVDTHVLDWMVDHRSDALTSIARFVTLFGGSVVVGGITVVVSVVLLAVRRRWLTAYLVTVVVGASLLSALGKAIVGRPRPPVAVRLASVGADAFPSGHATQAAATYVALAIVVTVVFANPRVRYAVRIGAVLVIVSVGISRLYLGVHWLTDVLAGWLLGGSWALGTARAFSPLGTPVRKEPRRELGGSGQGETTTGPTELEGHA